MKNDILTELVSLRDIEDILEGATTFGAYYPVFSSASFCDLKTSKILMSHNGIYFLPIFLFRRVVIEAFQIRMAEFQWLAV